MRGSYFLLAILISLFVSCIGDDIVPDSPLYEWPLQSYIEARIDGIKHDSIVPNCGESHTNNINSLTYVENDFIMRQGIELKVAEDIKIKCMIYIYDSTQRYGLYSPELMADYINNVKDNTSIDIEITKDNTAYKNQWFVDWDIPDFIRRKIVDTNPIYSIETEEPIRDRCTDWWPVLPVIVNYSGTLKTEDLQDSIRVDSLNTQFYLIEL